MMNRPFADLSSLLLNVKVTDPKGAVIDCQKAILQVARLVASQSRKGKKTIFVGNGGSASIASHMVTDFIRNLKIPALAFSDPSLLTCLSNDLGYENVFSAPIKVSANRGDILFAISSSGKSRNILNAVTEARKKGCFVVGLSGFSPKNPLRSIADINFHAPSFSYGDVEIAHLAICHAIVNTLHKDSSKSG